MSAAVQIIQSLLHEVIMEIIFWTVLTLIAGKMLLKVVRPDINRYVDKKAVECWNNLKNYLRNYF